MEMPTENTAAGPAALHPDSRDPYTPGNLILYRTSLALYQNLKNQGCDAALAVRPGQLLQQFDAKP